MAPILLIILELDALYNYVPWDDLVQYVSYFKYFNAYPIVIYRIIMLEQSVPEVFTETNCFFI